MPEENAVQQLSQARRLVLAYQEMFGQPGARTSTQNLVMADIEAFCFAYRLEAELRADADVAIHRMLVNQGKKATWLRIRGMVIKAMAQPKPLTLSREKKNNPTKKAHARQPTDDPV